MSETMQNELLRAAAELDLKIVSPFYLILPSGVDLRAEALFPELGAPQGTVVVTSRHSSPSVGRELRQLGYTMSSFGEPLEGQAFDLESYKEMFKEWGWTSEHSQVPDWFDE